MDTKRLEAEALQLPPKGRVRLAAKLVENLDDCPGAQYQQEIERLWVEESVRRAADLEANPNKGIRG